MDDLRAQRGLIIAATKRLKPKCNAWIVLVLHRNQQALHRSPARHRAGLFLP